MAVLLALAAALCYGLSDFLGGLLSRRTSPWAVATVAQTSSAACVLVLALVVSGGTPTAADLAWAAVAGLGSGSGAGFLYRGFSAGRMAVVGPVSAVGAAVVPVVAGAVGGERPAVLVWLGVVAALPAIWLVSSSPGSTVGMAAGLVDGLLAGLGFGLLFAALGQVPAEAGWWPVALCQGVSILAVVGLAAILGGDWVPRHRAAGSAAACGALGAAASVLFLLSTQAGYLTVAGVLSSLYPASTVLLAAVVLHERVHRRQGVGLVLCAAAVVLVASG